MFDTLITALGHNALSSEDKKSDNLHIAKYHAHLFNAAQDYILTQFPLVNISVRVVIATTFQLGHRHKGCATCAPLGAPAGLFGEICKRSVAVVGMVSPAELVLPRFYSHRPVAEDIRLMCRQEATCIRRFTLKHYGGRCFH